MAADVGTLPVPPPLDRLPYDDKSPEELWELCVKFGKQWRSESADQSPCSQEIRVKMDKFKKHKAINLVWMSNKLEGTLPKGASQYKTYRLLTELLDASDADLSGSSGISSNDGTGSESNKGAETYRLLTELSDASDAAKLDLSGSSDDGEDRKSQQQLVQHMQAYRRLCEIAVTRGEELSVDLIKETHRLLMDGLKNDGRPVTAGAYRQGPVFADDHHFPDHEHVPDGMDKIVREYNVKCSEADHDPYQLASWLLFEVISLHPFEDGNGRLCRLLWCYSLMRDGMPFPTVFTSGHKKKAYKHYIRALKKSQRFNFGCQDPAEQHSPLTSLTVLSVEQAWSNFFFNWVKYEK